MSFAAEPFAAFVEDLLTELTGGVARLRVRFDDDERGFALGGDPGRVVPSSVRVTGLADGVFTTFRPRADFTVADGRVTWVEDDDGRKAATATWPDVGTDVWVSFDRTPGPSAPLLTDRNPGSVVRTLAEAYSRELAVLSHQLDGIYRAAFLDTAQGRDLDAVAALVAVRRRGAAHARGQLVLRRRNPAAADITVPAGALVSTASSAAVRVTVETTETATLHRGGVSVAVPVRAVTAGPSGVAAATTLTVVHRPLFGIDVVDNPEPMTFGGATESDDELRSRVRRALDTAGRGTVGALKGALAALDEIREQDVLVEEDHLAFPGVVRVTVAAAVSPETAVLAARVLEDARPAGVRVVHNLPAPTVALPVVAQDSGGGGDGPVGVVLDGVFVPLAAAVAVTPADTTLTADQRDSLVGDVRAAVLAAVGDVGVGEPLIYNRVVVAAMAVDGVLDAVVEIGKRGELRRFNVRAPGRGALEAAARFALAPEDLLVTLRGDRLVVDLSAVVERRGLSASAEAGAALAAAKADIEQRLATALQVTPQELSPATLLGLLPATEDYAVERVSYRVELLDQGVRLAEQDVVVPVTPDQLVWIRSVRVVEDVVAG